RPTHPRALPPPTAPNHAKRMVATIDTCTEHTHLQKIRRATDDMSNFVGPNRVVTALPALRRRGSQKQKKQKGGTAHVKQKSESARAVLSRNPAPSLPRPHA
ncbi:MAG: hypothetical protein ACKOD5_07120, partial [Chthoniobacterales bacterium]